MDQNLLSSSSIQDKNMLLVVPSVIQLKNISVDTLGLTPWGISSVLKTEEISMIVGQYKSVAQYAKEAGFDAVEVYATNDYLINQFLRDSANPRTSF